LQVAPPWITKGPQPATHEPMHASSPNFLPRVLHQQPAAVPAGTVGRSIFMDGGYNAAMTSQPRADSPENERPHETIEADHRSIVEHVEADPDEFLYGTTDTEDWAERDAFSRRIRAVRAFLVSFMDAADEKRKGMEAARAPKTIRDGLEGLIRRSKRALWILEFGIPVPGRRRALVGEPRGRCCLAVYRIAAHTRQARSVGGLRKDVRGAGVSARPIGLPVRCHGYDSREVPSQNWSGRRAD
jgi:hypothetical protein